MIQFRPLNTGYGVRYPVGHPYYPDGYDSWLTASTFVEIIQSARTHGLAVIARTAQGPRVVWHP